MKVFDSSSRCHEGGGTEEEGEEEEKEKEEEEEEEEEEAEEANSIAPNVCSLADDFYYSIFFHSKL